MEYDELFTKLEQAIDAHPVLCRLTDNPIMAEPEVRVSRLGYTVEIIVKVRGSRKRPHRISDNSEVSVADAIESLIGGLDIWAKILAG